MARQRKRGNPILSAIIFGIFGLVLLFLGVRTFIGLHGDLLNVTTCDPSEIRPGVYVEGTISYGYGAYIEKTTTYNHVVTKTDGYYYLVDICDKNADGTAKDSARWIGISIAKSDDSKFDAISSQDDAAPIHITGVIRENSSKIQGFLDDYITKYVDMYAKYYGYTPTSEDYASAKAEAFPYYIEMVDSFDYIFNLGLGSIFLLVAVFMILKATRSRNHISAPAQQPAGASYYNGTGDFNGVYNNGTGDLNGVYNNGTGDLNGVYNNGTGDLNGVYNSEPDPLYSQPTVPEEQPVNESVSYETIDRPSSSTFSLKSDD